MEKNIPKLGTYNNININDFIEKHKSTLKINNSFKLETYIKELKSNDILKEKVGSVDKLNEIKNKVKKTKTAEVLGKTLSGKNIYNHDAYNDNYKDFLGKDHRDAYNVHVKLMDNYKTQYDEMKPTTKKEQKEKDKIFKLYEKHEEIKNQHLYKF